MIPIYKAFSLLLRVFSRPLINYTKKIHANNPSQSTFIRNFFIWFGNFYHRVQAKINRKFLKIQSQFAFKPLNDELAIQKGIQFFYELVFYAIVIGVPLYEMNRTSEQSRVKSQKVQERLNSIQGKIQRILEEVEIIGKRQKIIEFVKTNRGKYCFPNLKVNIRAEDIKQQDQQYSTLMQYKMCLL